MKTYNQYFTEGNKIITNNLLNTYNTFLTQAGANAINNHFEYEKGKLLMYESDPIKVELIANYILNKNMLSYENLYKTLTAEYILNTYSSKTTRTLADERITDTPSEQKTTNRPAESTTTHKPAETTDETTFADTTKEITPGTKTQTKTPSTETETFTHPTESINHSPAETTLSKNTTQQGTKTTTRSTKPYDSTEFHEVEKNEEIDNPSDEDEILTVQTQESTTKTYTGTDQVQRSYTQETEQTTEQKTTETNKYDNAQQTKLTVDSNETTQQEYTKDGFTQNEVISDGINLKEFLNDEVIEEIKPLDILNNIEKLRGIFQVNLWDKIINDLDVVLSLKVWPLCYDDMLM